MDVEPEPSEAEAVPSGSLLVGNISKWGILGQLVRTAPGTEC